MSINSPSFRTLPLPRESNGWGLTVENGVHWFLAPNGEKFYGSGVNGVDAGCPPEEVHGRPAYYLWQLYDSTDAWAATIRERLVKWGFNHLGAWNFCDEKIGLPSIANLDLGRLRRGDHPLGFVETGGFQAFEFGREMLDEG